MISSFLVILEKTHTFLGNTRCEGMHKGTCTLDHKRDIGISVIKTVTILEQIILVA